VRWPQRRRPRRRLRKGRLRKCAPNPVAVAGPQVVLKIRRRKFQQQDHVGEIHVTRRLFRSGDSEYLLNGKLCRLRDIQELFMGTGLGPESYALIEQGRIGQILSSRPTDRRAIIEEAAGITKFKTKKRLAEARLEDAKTNLNRVNDIFEEVTRQMNSLKRQASKAERYAKLRDEMRAKLRIVLASKFTQMDQESATLDTQINQLGEEIRQQTESVQQSEAEHSERTQRGYAIETETRQNRERLNQIAIEGDRGKARIRTNEERCAELIARMASAEAELAQAQTRWRRLRKSATAISRCLTQRPQISRRPNRSTTSASRKRLAPPSILRCWRSEQESHRTAILEAVGGASNLRNQLTQSEERLAGIGREEQRLRLRSQPPHRNRKPFGGQRGQIALEFESVSQRASGLTAEIASLRETIERSVLPRTTPRSSSTRSAPNTPRRSARRDRSKRSSPSTVIPPSRCAGSFNRERCKGGNTPAGVLADFLEVEPRYERVVEDFLRDELNFVVVKSWDAADEGLRLLRSDVNGRATFLVHPEDSQGKFSFLADESHHYAPLNDTVIPLKNSIRVLNGFGKSLEVILPKLGNGYIVPDPAVARELALSSPDAFFLSQTGECFHNVTVTGGKQRSEGPLSMKRELRDVLRLLEELERALREKEMLALTLGREIKEHTSLLDRLEDEKREAEKQAMTSGHLLQQLDGEMTRVRERIAISERELQRLAAERQEQEDLIASRQAELAMIENRVRGFETKLAAGQDRLAALRSQRDSSAETTSQRAAASPRSKSVIVRQQLLLQRIETLVSEMRERAGALQTQMESATRGNRATSK
jgi:chromosome segregation protein